VARAVAGPAPSVLDRRGPLGGEESSGASWPAEAGGAGTSRARFTSGSLTGGDRAPHTVCPKRRWATPEAISASSPALFPTRFPERPPAPEGPLPRPVETLMPGAGDDKLAELARYSGIGLQFAATFVLFTLGGRWLDGRWESSPWCLLVGVALGFSLGLFSLLKKLPPARGSSRRPPPAGPQP